MTDRLDLHRMSQETSQAAVITPSLVIYSCLDDRYQSNIKYLEENKCKVGQLRTTLLDQIQDSEESARELGGSPMNQIATRDGRLVVSYLEDYIKKTTMPPTFEEVMNFIIEEHGKNSDMFEEVIFALRSAGYNPKTVAKNNKYKTLNKYCTDLVVKAKNNRLDPLIGREKEVERMIEILAHYKKKNPLLVGEAGTGKTQIVEGLASAIAQGKVPEAIKGAKIFSTSIARIVAGTKFRGDMEEKVEMLLAELKQHEKETGLPTFLFIDEVHQIVGAGQGGSNSDGSNVANILKPSLSNGELALIGATTGKEYKRTIQKDDALNRRFQVVRIDEPSDEETIQILRKGISPVLTDYHGVKYSKAVIERAVRLSSKYITDKAQPDKSISILDSIGARLRTTESRGSARISDVESLISAITGTPVSAFKERTKAEQYVDIEDELNKVVFGQTEAVKSITEIYERSKAGLNEEGQPIGSVLAIGPTGVGKTEIARSLAKVTDSHFFKINMGEYTEEHSVAKLFGSPPGYVGHKEGGLLTNEIRKNPHTVLLLDEIEKAHPKVYEALLGIIDGAKMTSGEGDVVDFGNVLVIMTSNVGAASAASRNPITLSGSAELVAAAKAQVSMKALESTFSPEFRNKITATINFKSLGGSEIRRVTDKFLSLATVKLEERKGVKVEFTEEVYEFISKEGFQPEFGARPIKKLIDTKVIDVLIKPILRGQINKGDKVTFSVLNEDITYTVNEVTDNKLQSVLSE